MAEQKLQQISTEEMFGIAKKFALQLKSFPMETESAIVEMVRVSMQHRNLQMQREQQQAEMDNRQRETAMREQQLELMRMAQQRQDSSLVATGVRVPQAARPNSDIAVEEQPGLTLVPSAEEVAEYAGEPVAG